MKFKAIEREQFNDGKRAAGPAITGLSGSVAMEGIFAVSI